MSFAPTGYQPRLVMTGSWDPSSSDYPGTMRDENWVFSPHNPENWENGQPPYMDPGRFLEQWGNAIKEALHPGGFMPNDTPLNV